MTTLDDGARDDGRTATLVARLVALVDGLTYASEGDYPFAVVTQRDPDPSAPLDAALLRRALGLAPTTPIELRPVDALLARHTHATDPLDARAQALRPRYEALAACLAASLHDVTGVRAGRTQVRTWLLGRDDAGRLVGVETLAIET